MKVLLVELCKGKGTHLESRYLCDYTCSSDLPPLAVGAQQPATIDPTLDLCKKVPIMAGLTDSVWNIKFVRHSYTWPALGIELQT